ncbi:MAG: hypothetical protein GEV10_06835 [Streptosporangiales bacterium]|nr:hypothetical protein [Streptosporangiales bacterium]
MATTYVNLAVRAPVDETVGVLEVAGIPGVVGPQAGEWCGVFLDGDGYGLVGADRKPPSSVALRLSDRVDSTVVLVSVFEGRVLGYDLFDHGKATGYYVSRPGEWTGEDLLSEGGDAEVLAKACGRLDLGDELAEVLVRDAEVDEVVRHRRLAGLLALPPYLVGTATSEAHEGADADYLVLEPVPVKRRDNSRTLRIVALGLACFALFVWVQAFREGSWGTAVFAVIATGVAVLAAWLGVGRSKVGITSTRGGRE